MERAPHDVLFRHAFGQLEHARGLLQALLPPDLGAALDWTSLRPLPGSFVDPKLRQQQRDLLWSARLDGQDALLYLLVEHKARDERFAVLQLQGYVQALWRSGRRRGAAGGRALPFVVPVLLHQGRRPWRAPRRLAELFAPGAGAVASSLLALQPAFAPLVVSMADWPPERLRGLGLTVFGKLVCEALVRLPGSTFDEAAAVLRSWRELLRALARAPSAADALEALFRYVLLTAEGRPEQLLEVVAEVLEDEPMGKRITAGQILIERGRQEGLAVGREEGREEGREAGRQEGREAGREEGALEGRRALFLTQLRARFRRLSARVVARIDRADAAQLDRWAVRLLAAERLDDVFARP